MKMNPLPPIVYGPLLSRRHGISLGINLGASDQKTCTWGCVYCQCGHGRRDSLSEHLDTIPTTEEVVSAVKAALQLNPDVDCVTFAGNTEPTSHPAFAEIVQSLLSFKRSSKATWLLKCLSNGSGLSETSITQACDSLDETWLKLDCADQDLFMRLNRPEKNSSNLSTHLTQMRGLKNLRIQTMLWGSATSKKLGNLSDKHLDALLELYVRLSPLEVHLATIEREAPTPGLTCASPDLLARFAKRVENLGIKVSCFQSRLESFCSPKITPTELD